VVQYRLGDDAAVAAQLKRLTSADPANRTRALFFSGRPRQAIEAQRQASFVASACELLALQGRRREALALSGEREIPNDDNQRVTLLVEQAVLLHRMGEKARADKLLAGALERAEKARTYGEFMLATIMSGGIRMNRRKEVAADVGKVLDRLKPVPPLTTLFYTLSERDSDLLGLWWDYLRQKSPTAKPSATLARMRGWFEGGKPDKGFDDLVADAERQALPADQQDRWRAALARTCVAVGKPKKAEELLRTAARIAKSVEGYQRLGDFYFDRKDWSKAAAEYEQALQQERRNAWQLAVAGHVPKQRLAVLQRERGGNALVRYLRGVTLIKLGKREEGRALIELARCMPLADEAERYKLARGLGRRGLRDEAEAEWLLLLRAGEFHSVYATNAAGALVGKAVREKRPLETAYLCRRMAMNLVVGGGAFLDGKAYLRVPGHAHLYQASGLAGQGKWDAALAEIRRGLEYLPEEIGSVIDMVRALDQAKRKSDADKLFAEAFARQRKACAEAPRSAHLKNQLAWLAVRCGRQLDVALHHAKGATTLEPRSPAYMDTLAEVHFQRGDSKAAVAAMKRVLELAPGNAYFKAQLRRIEAGDPKADLPRR
jgi:tetratricopeptide (TPR) repeat protein